MEKKEIKDICLLMIRDKAGLFFMVLIDIMSVVSLLAWKTVSNAFGRVLSKSIIRLMMGGIKNSSKINYFSMYKDSLNIIALAGVVLLIVHLVISVFVFDDFSTSIGYYGLYKSFLIYFSVFIGYSIAVFNRFKFYIVMNNLCGNQI